MNADAVPDERTRRDVDAFETHRRDLLALAYRMLGDLGRAEDMVQETWLRWHRRDASEGIESPKAYLVTIVTRLSLNELASARARHEASREDHLPEPIDLAHGGLDRLEAREQLSMAFLVVLQRLTPAERAVVLLHDVFDFPHDDIAPLIGKTAIATRKLLERARGHLDAGRAMISASRAEHERLLEAFVSAAGSGDTTALVDLLARDASVVTDGGEEGRTFGRLRNLKQPLTGAERVAAFVTAAAQQSTMSMEPRVLNGQPAIVFVRDGSDFAAMLLGVADSKIRSVFFCADAARLGHLRAAT